MDPYNIDLIEEYLLIKNYLKKRNIYCIAAKSILQYILIEYCIVIFTVRNFLRLLAYITNNIQCLYSKWISKDGKDSGYR